MVTEMRRLWPFNGSVDATLSEVWPSRRIMVSETLNWRTIGSCPAGRRLCDLSSRSAATAYAYKHIQLPIRLENKMGRSGDAETVRIDLMCRMKGVSWPEKGVLAEVIDEKCGHKTS